MESHITDIALSVDNGNNLLLVIITNEMFAKALLDSLGYDLQIKSSLSESDITVIIPAFGGNGAVKIDKRLDDNPNWINLHRAAWWSVGFRKGNDTRFLMPLRPLFHIDNA